MALKTRAEEQKQNKTSLPTICFLVWQVQHVLVRVYQFTKIDALSQNQMFVCLKIRTDWAGHMNLRRYLS